MNFRFSFPSVHVVCLLSLRTQEININAFGTVWRKNSYALISIRQFVCFLFSCFQLFYIGVRWNNRFFRLIDSYKSSVEVNRLIYQRALFGFSFNLRAVDQKTCSDVKKKNVWNKFLHCRLHWWYAKFISFSVVFE